MKKKKKKRLRTWVKVTLTIILSLIVVMLFIKLAEMSNDRFNYWSKKCDTASNHTCSYYEVRQTMIRG